MIDTIAALGHEMALAAGEILMGARQSAFRIEAKANGRTGDRTRRRVESEIIARIKAAYPTTPYWAKSPARPRVTRRISG